MDVAYYDQQGTFYWGAGNGQGNGTCVLNVTSYDSVNHKIGGKAGAMALNRY